jgi:hypothetical protein
VLAGGYVRIFLVVKNGFMPMYLGKSGIIDARSMNSTRKKVYPRYRSLHNASHGK